MGADLEVDVGLELAEVVGRAAEVVVSDDFSIEVVEIFAVSETHAA